MPDTTLPEDDANEPVVAEIVSIAPNPFDLGASSGSGSAYSLLLLFYLTTIAAILAAACRLALSNSAWTASAFFSGWLTFGVVGLILGSVTAFFVARTAKGMFLGIICGIAVGMIASFMTLIAPVHFSTLITILPIGCWFLILITVLANRWTN